MPSMSLTRNICIQIFWRVDRQGLRRPSGVAAGGCPVVWLPWQHLHMALGSRLLRTWGCWLLSRFLLKGTWVSYGCFHKADRTERLPPRSEGQLLEVSVSHAFSHLACPETLGFPRRAMAVHRLVHRRHRLLPFSPGV